MSARTVNYNIGEKIERQIPLSLILKSDNPRQSLRGVLEIFHEKGAAHNSPESRAEYIAYIEANFPFIRQRAESLKTLGQLQAVTLRSSRTKDEWYTICQGECRILGWSLLEAETGEKQTVRAIVEKLTLDEAFERGLAENIEREDMSPMDIARSFHEMLTTRINPATTKVNLPDGTPNPLYDERYPKGRPYSLKQIAEKFGKDYHWVRNRASLVYLSSNDQLTVNKNHQEGKRDLTRFCKKATALAVELKAKAKDSGQEVSVLLEQFAEQVAQNVPQDGVATSQETAILTVPSQPKKRRVKKLADVEQLFDATPLENKERLMALAEVMGITYEVALAERESRFPSEAKTDDSRKQSA